MQMTDKILIYKLRQNFLTNRKMGNGYEKTVQKRSNSNVNKHVKRSLTSLVVRQIQ